MRKLLRLLAILAVPLITGLYLLHESRPDYRPLDLPAPSPPLKVSGPVEVQPVQLRFRLDNGRPAADAVVIVTAPRMEYAETDAEGVAVVELPAGPVKLHAFHTGMQLMQWGPEAEPPKSPLTFAALPDTRPRMETPGGAAEARLRVQGTEGEPLAGALVLVRPADDAEEAPWVGLADAEGALWMRGLPAGPLRASIHGPGMPPTPASLLGEADFAAGAEEPIALSCAVAWLTLEGRRPDALVELRRVDVEGTFPDRLVPADGVLPLGPLPVGQYVVNSGGQEMELELKPGRHSSR